MHSRLHALKAWLAMQLEDATQKNAIPALDGVRAIACLSVLAFHISLITRDARIWQLTNRYIGSVMLAGGSGVTLFFILSGFLLFLPYGKALLCEGNWPSTRHFYVRRIFRIVPAYYLSLLLMILFFHPEYLRPEHLKELPLFFIFYMDSSPATFLQINGPFWTLAVEWQFYMLLPWLAWGISRIVRRGTTQSRCRRLLFCLIGIIIWGIGTREFGLYFTAHPDQTILVPRPVLNVILFFTYGVSGKYLEDFAVGMLISLCYAYARLFPSDNRFVKALGRLSPWLFGGGLLVLYFMAMWLFNMWYPHRFRALDGLTPLYSEVSEICLAIGFGLCVTAILFGAAGLKRLFEVAALRWIGVISYSLYMWHLPLLVCILNYVGHKIPSWDNALAYGMTWFWAFFVIIPFAFLFYVWVEKPWMQLGARLLHREREANSGEVAPAPTKSAAESNALHTRIN